MCMCSFCESEMEKHIGKSEFERSELNFFRYAFPKKEENGEEKVNSSEASWTFSDVLFQKKEENGEDGIRSARCFAARFHARPAKNAPLERFSASPPQAFESSHLR